jgi:hypothetical protein
MERPCGGGLYDGRMSDFPISALGADSPKMGSPPPSVSSPLNLLQHTWSSTEPAVAKEPEASQPGTDDGVVNHGLCLILADPHQCIAAVPLLVVDLLRYCLDKLFHLPYACAPV